MFLYFSSFSKKENSWSPKVDEKGNIFYLEVAEKCKQLRLKEFSESSVDDVGYGTDNELNNISNLITSGVKFPEETIFSKEECLAENCMCSQQNDKDPDFFRMDNLVQFKIPVKPVNVLKINGDTPKQHGYVGKFLCKDLLGIIPGHFKSSKTSSNQRLRIRGLDPTRDILKKKHVQNGKLYLLQRKENLLIFDFDFWCFKCH